MAAHLTRPAADAASPDRRCIDDLDAEIRALALLSYSKVRALTRVGQLHDEDSLLAYALNATAPQVEERCRQIRNVAPESRVSAWRAWERRSLTLLRDEARGLIRISVEVPIERARSSRRRSSGRPRAATPASGSNSRLCVSPPWRCASLQPSITYPALRMQRLNRSQYSVPWRRSRRNVFKCRSAPRASPSASRSRDRLKCASA